MKYKVGDIVKIVNWETRPDHWNSAGEMDYLKGKHVKIDEISINANLPYSIINTNKDTDFIHWWLSDSDIVGKYSDEELE